MTIRRTSLFVLRRGRLRAVDDVISMAVNTPLLIDVLANDRGHGLKITEIDGLPIIDGGAAVSISNGSVTLASGVLTVTPTAAYTGPISFRYTVVDGTQSRAGMVVGNVV